MKRKINTTRKFKFTLVDSTTGNIPSGNVTYLLSFFVPLLMFIILYYLRDFFPFGESCYLRSDMYHQYAPFFSELWDKIRNGESLTYSFDIGMGTNFLSLYAYYLASPSNWIIALFSQKYMIEIMNLIIILKMSAASTTVSYYISKHFNTKSCTIALFGFFYSMSAYVAAYSWNIMWLDCILLFPLVMLGLERLVKENKCVLYCVSLGLSIFSNYYIAIMVCMAVILYFFVLIISYDGLRKPVIYLKKFINWSIYSLLAGGLAACLLLPEIYTFTLSASSNTSFPKTLSIYFSILEMAVRHLINVPVHLGLEHYPNIYCGVAIFLLLPLYIMCKKINAREKIGKCVILLVFLLAYNFNTLNFIWHGFHFPNSLPCRQAFIYIFFILVMSYEAIYNLKSLSSKNITTALWFSLLFLVFAEQIFSNTEYDTQIFYISGAFILIYALLIYVHRFVKSQYPIALFLAFGVVVIECIVNMDATGLGATNRTAYLLDYDAVKTVTEAVEETDKSFYRMDKIYGARSKNDGAWHNYHSISTFSSTCPKGMSDLYKNLGLVGSTNAYGYDGSTMLTNSLFSVKYLISNKILSQSNLLSYVNGSDGEFIYQNNYTLPLGYVVDNTFTHVWQTDSAGTAIDNQNSMISAMTGVNDVFVLEEIYTGATQITITPSKNAHMYIAYKSSSIEKIDVEVNNRLTTYSNLKNNPHTIDLGYVSTDESIHVTCDSATNLHVYNLDEEAFIKAYNILNDNSYNIESWSETHFKGTLNTSKDGTFLMSIPYDKGWSVYVDGKKVSTFAAKEALLAINIEKGTHDIELKYVPVNMILGCIITAICIIILIASQILLKAMRNGKISTDKLPVFINNLINEEDSIIETPELILVDADELPGHKELLEQMEELDDFDNLELEDFEGRNNS